MDYAECVVTSERVAWTVDQVLGDRKLDLSKRFLPEELACVEGLAFLSADEKRVLNQIRGHSYAYLFYFIEESILRAVIDQIASTRGDPDRLRALLRFADEEIKHQRVFLELCARYREQTKIAPGLLAERATAEDVAATLGKSSPLAVLVTILHIEWVSQRHFVEAVRGSAEDLEPLFTSVLKFHWVEEAQHTKIDQLLIAKLVAKATPEDIERAIDEYLELGKAIDGLLYMQMELDVATFERAIGRSLSETDRAGVLHAQSTACRKALLWMGMTNPPFDEFLASLTTKGRDRVRDAARTLVA
jgi:hypothetical protein